jgi:hypothetical protein
VIGDYHRLLQIEKSAVLRKRGQDRGVGRGGAEVIGEDAAGAVAHLARGLRDLSVFIDDNLGEDGPSVIAELTALERLSLAGNMIPEDGPSSLLDDDALTAIAELPALEALSLLGGSYTEHGLQQLTRLPKLQHLHLEREDLTAPMFQFAATMPALTRLTGLDEFGDDGPMDPAEFAPSPRNAPALA